MIVLACLGCTVAAAAVAPTSALRVTLVAPDRSSAVELAGLQAAFTTGFGFESGIAGASAVGGAPLADMGAGGNFRGLRDLGRDGQTHRGQQGRNKGFHGR